MGVDPQYRMHFPRTPPNFAMDRRKPTIAPTDTDESFHIAPGVNRLFTAFDTRCPNLYRLHCSDTLRTLEELICLADEYLHVRSSSVVSTIELLSNERYFNDFVTKVQCSLLYHHKYYRPMQTELRCFGQGIHPCNYYNELDQTLVFCFELTSKSIEFLPVGVHVLDPNDDLVLTDIKYINTYAESNTRLFSCSYTPRTRAGIYKISFFYNNMKISNHRYTVFVRNSTASSSLPCRRQRRLEEPLIGVTMPKPQPGTIAAEYLT